MNKMSRRDWMRLAVSGGGGLALAPRAAMHAASLQTPTDGAARVLRLVAEYSSQGFHRTGTAPDQRCAEWLAQQVRDAGVVPALEPFPVSRVDPGTNVLVAGPRRVEGLPLFDGGFTSAAGVIGALGPLQSAAPIGLGDTVPNRAGAGMLGDARRAAAHAAIVCVTRGGRPGLCPSNAEAFLRPSGPPVLQVSSRESEWLAELARRGGEVQVIAQATRTAATAANVTAAIEGTDPSLAPIVVSTPRSGWYECASERGGGIVCWLDTLRALRAARLRRRVVFVAFSGHEVGSLGIHAFVERRPTVVSDAAAWVHFGANIGAATGGTITLGASDDAIDARVSAAIGSSGLAVTQRIPRGNLPGGEAAEVHRGGGRYVAITGSNQLFHNPDDVGPQVVDPAFVTRVAAALIEAITAMA